MGILSFVAETAKKVFNALAGSADTVITVGSKAVEYITPENIVKTAKVAVSLSVIYSVVIKKTIPFFWNLFKGMKKGNKPFAATISAAGGKGDRAKEARKDIDEMTTNAAKAIRKDNAGIYAEEDDFFGATIKSDDSSIFSRDDRTLLQDLKKKTSKNYNDEEVQRETFIRNTPDYLDRVMGRTEKVELPEVQNKYFRDYLACDRGHRRPLNYTFKDDYVVIGDTIFTAATVADAYLDYVEEVLVWMRSERPHPKYATQFEYMFYNETLPAVANAGFHAIKAKAKEKPLTLGEFKKALNWFIENSQHFRPDCAMKYYTPNVSR